MSFRGRLTSFFVLIVVVPMVSLTFVLFRLISDNENAKANAAIAARQEAAMNLSTVATHQADAAILKVGQDVPLATALRRSDRAAAERRATVLLKRLGMKRIVIREHGKTLADVGAGNAVFPAIRQLKDCTTCPVIGQIAIAAQGPRSFADTVKQTTGGREVIVRSGMRTLASTLPNAESMAIPLGGRDVTVGGRKYRAATFSQPGFDGPQYVSLLDDAARTASNVRSARLLAGLILAGFFILAFTFAVLVSRSLQRQIASFLEVARRLGGGDFTAEVPTVGHDEFAALGEEFNRMSKQLESRLEELGTERARLADAMRRIGETFASNLDRDGLLEIVLRTALDGVSAGGGRATVRTRRDQAFEQVAQAGSLDGLVPALHAAESAVLEAGAPREATADGVTALAHPLRGPQGGPGDGPPRVNGIVSVARAGRPFTPSETELFHYLAGQASVSVENVGLHETVERQAVTDELTGLSNRRRFQETLTTEVERSRRFGQPLGLVMLDIDDFKNVNDNYGHQTGDLVLREVARILRESSREIDEPARYGGEELAVVLPGTDLEGAFNLAERVRLGLQELDLPVLRPDGLPLKVTASFGVATMPGSGHDARAVVAAADAALYEAKRTGKNRTVRAEEVQQA